MALATSSVESLLPSPRRVRVAAATGHIVGAHFAFSDHASNAAFETRCRSSLLERISSRRRFWLFAQNHQLFAV
jgi:hypothetical protein